jgi:nucleotide-binding universal stress UspA family protein
VSLRESVALRLGPRDPYYARQSEQALRPARAALERAGIRTESVAAVGDAGERLAAIAAERDVDLVVLGSHGRGGAKRLVMGSVSRSVLARVDAPVLIVR